MKKGLEVSSHRSIARDLVCVILFAVLPLLQGCFFGTFQSARTVGRGKTSGTIFLNLPTYVSEKDRKSAKRDNYSPPITAGALYQVGVSDNADFGVQVIQYGLGVNGKVKFALNGMPVDFAVAPSVTYLFGRAQLSPMVAGIVGKTWGDLDIYAGLNGAYGPDWRERRKGVSFSDLPTRVTWALFAGTKVSVSGEAQLNPWLPKSLVFELGVPLDIKYNLIYFGVGVGGFSGLKLPF